MKKQGIILIIVGIVIIFGLLFFYNIIGRSIRANSEKYDNLAKCLTQKGIKMYGTEWCSHCKDQKRMFGSSFKFIEYIDCDTNKDICLAEGINGYPTWKINGKSYPGAQPLETLAQLSGCEL